MKTLDNYLIKVIVEIKSLKEISISEANQLKPLWEKFKKETSESSYFKYREQPYEKWMSKLKDGRVKILLAVEGNKSIGFIIGFIKNNPVNPEYRGASIEGIYLEPEYRNKGIADEMFKGIMNWFKENTESVVRLRTMGANKRAQNFYKKMGFIPEIITMRNKDSR